MNDVHVSEPVLPRRRKTPRRLEVGTGESHFPETVQDYYRAQYFEALDFLTSCIFDQPGYRIYSKLEALLLNSANGVEFMAEFDEIMQLYAQDFNQELLKSQLAILKTHFNDHSEPVRLSVVHEFLMNLGEARSLLSEVVKLITLILVMPATNATSECSFSALKKVKTFLRRSMKQSRLNHLVLLHVHKDITDNLDYANDFVSTPPTGFWQLFFFKLTLLLHHLN